MIKRLNIVLIHTALSAVLLSSPVAFAQQFYKWVDSKGSTHYTTTPPPKNAKKTAKVDTYGSRQQSQSKATNSANPAQNNNSTSTQPKTDTQQQEANAALEQGRNRP